MLAHAQIVVRTPDHYVSWTLRCAPDRGRAPPGDALQFVEHAVAFLLVQPRERLGEESIVGHVTQPPDQCCICKFINSDDGIRLSFRFVMIQNDPTTTRNTMSRPNARAS